MSEPLGEIVLYQRDDGSPRIEVRLSDETVWLSLNQLAELFQRDKSTISRHIRNVFAEGELTEGACVADFATHLPDGRTYQVTHYNLDVIISVGYRVEAGRVLTCVMAAESSEGQQAARSLLRLGGVDGSRRDGPEPGHRGDGQ